jgi:hypothetical protein
MLGLVLLLLGYASHSRALFVAYHVLKAVALTGGFRR